MMKKLTMICMALALTAALWAQGNNERYGKKDNAGRGIYGTHMMSKDIDFPADSIKFWCGTGDSAGIVIVAWDNDDIEQALAWGVRWNGDITALNMLDTIVTYDSRLTYTYSGSLMQDVTYQDSTTTIHSDYIGWCYYRNGSWAPNAYGNQPVVDGDVIEISSTCMFTMTDAEPASNPYPDSDPDPVTPDTNSLAMSDVLYWVGTGESGTVIAVNWADTCLAWGVHFSDSITLEAAMDSIACADYRFSYEAGAWGINDILYHDHQGTNLALTHDDPTGFNYWWTNINGWAAMLPYNVLYLRDGDFVKWGDAAYGTVMDTACGYPSELAWNTPITPIAPLTAGPFCGAAGTDGSTAIEYSSTAIKGWATACTLELGPANIADPASATVSYGTADEAVGPVTGDNLRVVSLGDGGMATLTFEHPIANGEGYDFAVYENSFNDNFLELAFVEVSSDGEHFVRFPSTSLTPTCHELGQYGSVDPTFIDNLAGKYRSGFGTPFDLEQLRDSANLNLDSIMYVRIVDVVGTNNPEYATFDQYGNIIMDPYPTDGYSSGFDLDGVAVLNWNYTPQTEGIDAVDATSISLFPNPANSLLSCTVEGNGQHIVTIYNTTGQMVYQGTFSGKQTTLSTADIADGIYVVRIDGNAQRLVVKH